jgi:hypothetical protein
MRTAAVHAVVLAVLTLCAFLLTRLQASQRALDLDLSFDDRALAAGAAGASCSAVLPGVCTTALTRVVDGLQPLAYGATMAFDTRLLQLTQELEALAALTACAAAGAGAGAASGCPDTAAAPCAACYCAGLAGAPQLNDAAWLSHVREACGTYIEPVDVRKTAIRTGISAVIFCLNYCLVLLLRRLVKLPRHWTATSEARAQCRRPPATAPSRFAECAPLCAFASPSITRALAPRMQGEPAGRRLPPLVLRLAAAQLRGRPAGGQRAPGPRRRRGQGGRVRIRSPPMTRSCR